VPLATRRASRTVFDGAMVLTDAEIEARTGASIRGSNMVVVMSCGVKVNFMRLFEVRAAFSAFGTSAICYAMPMSRAHWRKHTHSRHPDTSFRWHRF
jgi:hypothetical protein